MLFILQFYNRWFKIGYPMFIKQSINNEWSKYFNERLSCLQQSWVSLKYVFWFYLSLLQYHCLKRVRIWNFYGLYFPVFRLNKEICGVNLFIQSKCGKIRARKTPNTDTFHAVCFLCWRCNHIGSLHTNSSFMFIWIEISNSWHEALSLTSKKDGNKRKND